MENTVIEMGDDLSGKDHLHIRGEYQTTLQLANPTKGSPPHTWRILIAISDGFPKFGITSTYVENTFSFPPLFHSGWDHLHIRGEYTC